MTIAPLESTGDRVPCPVCGNAPKLAIRYGEGHRQCRHYVATEAKTAVCGTWYRWKAKGDGKIQVWPLDDDTIRARLDAQARHGIRRVQLPPGTRIVEPAAEKD